MGFLDFLFGTNRKTDMKDDSLFGPTDTAPTNLIEMDEEFSEDLVKDNLDTPFFKEDKSYLQNGVHMKMHKILLNWFMTAF